LKDKFLLDFDLTEWEIDSLLENEKIVIMRKFILENEGNLAIFIKKMSIDGGKCSGHGFEIVNCLTAKIKEGENKDLDIVLSLSGSSLGAVLG
jgi:3-dehydroquinate dehydratase